jgi:E3 ubiquitin-protein ligase listerin
LPDELLSLLLDAPIGQNFPDEILAQFPPTIRRYLFAWLLIFASYPKASYKVRSDYNDILKSEQYLSPLLDFLFDALGHSSARPLNLDRSQLSTQLIQAYDAKAGEDLPDERNLEWLLVHLWYMCLKYAPTLAKNWWIDCKSRQTRVVVESWTEKYFSPLLIEEALSEVATWAEHQDSSDDNEKDLLIKVLKKPREVYAGYEVDEMEMQIVIRLPANYPLEGVKVDGINRVAVSEKKWKSWLMVTQGVITFSVHFPPHPQNDALTACRTAPSPTASASSAKTSPARSRAKPNAPSATPSSHPTGRCRKPAARPASTSTTPAVS